MAKKAKEQVEAPAQAAQVENPQVQQPSYEELAQAYNELRMRSDRNDVITRLQFDFIALEHTKELPKNYVNAVIRDVMTLLPMDGVDVEAEVAKLGKKA